jgi:hypothetical protein
VFVFEEEDAMSEVKVAHNRVNGYTTVIDMVFIAVVAVVFNFFPQVVGIYNLPASGPGRYMPILTPEFQIILPWLNLWWGLAFTLEVARLIQRRKTFVTCWLDCGLHAYGAVLLGWMALDSRFITSGARETIGPLLGLTSIVLLIWTARRVSIARRGQQIVLELKRA